MLMHQGLFCDNVIHRPRYSAITTRSKCQNVIITASLFYQHPVGQRTQNAPEWCGKCKRPKITLSAKSSVDAIDEQINRHHLIY